MKRGREENGSGSQLKRHTSLSRGEMSESATQSQRLTTSDALTYLQAVKDIFKDKKGKYDEFLEVMKDFKAQRIDTAGVIARVKDLFRGHRDLILGFNTFLPKGYEITLPLEEEPPKRQPVEYGQAISYVNKIKTTFQQEEQVYKAFLEILNMYRKGNKSISEVYKEVALLFKDHPNLLEEFTCFLPDSRGLSQPFSKSVSVPRRDEKSLNIRHVKREKIVNAPAQGGAMLGKAMDQEHHEHITTEADKLERGVKKEREIQMDQEERDSEEEGGDKYLDAMQRLPNKRKSARRADELIRKQSLGAVEAIVGSSALLVSVEDKKAPKGLQRKLAFFEDVKSKLRSQETYQEFLKCLNLYSEEIITREQLHSLVNGILGKHTDLVEGFNDFLAHCESNEGYLANIVNKKLGDGPPLKPKVERGREKETGRENDKGDHGRDAEKEKEREKHAARDFPGHKTLQSREKYVSKPISELDLSSCEKCTPSYRLLPKSYPKPVASYRKALARDVLNDSWVSVTSGSEDYSFKHMRRNQYEESLFRCEDDRFELDMLLESTAVTSKRLEELLKKLLEGNAKQDGQVHPNDYLTAINIRCIERIYGDHGLDVIDMLHKNGPVALPVILNRLKQKQEEWLKCKEDMNKVWAEVYAKNYHKSLDHRSFYFKQQDKKNLSVKALLAEIKGINEKKRKDDDFILSRAAGNRQPLIPDLKFDYHEPDVNEDLYQIIKHSADEMCSTMEQSDKIMRLWTTFFEPVFGVPSRSHDAEDTEEVSKGKTIKVENHSSCIPFKRGASVDKEGHTCFSNDITRMEKGASSLRAEENVSVASVTDDSKTEKSASADRKSDVTVAVSSQQVIPCSTKLNEKNRKMNDYSLHSERRLLPESKQDTEILDNPDGPQNSFSGKIEREEGELSPSPETDEKIHENLGSIGLLKQEQIVGGGFDDHIGEDEDIECDGKAESEQVVDADEEEGEGEGEGEGEAEGEGEEEEEEEEKEEEKEEDCALKSSDDSDNPSPVEDVSGSESANGDDLREGHDNDDDEQEVKNESEGEVEGMADAEGEATSLASSEKLLLSCMPLKTHAPSIISNSTANSSSTVFYGNDTLYVLFRLHQALYERINAAKVHAIAAEEKQKSPKDNSSELYRKFMQVLYSLLDGTVDNVKFEDDCRAIIGTQSYVLFTMDKLIFKLVKQLQSITSDDMANKLLALHTYEKSRASGFIDSVYHANAATVLQDENIYRFEHRSNPSQLFIQLMDSGGEKTEASSHAIESTFFSYLNAFLYETYDLQKPQSPVFLKRNKQLCHEGDEKEALGKAMHNVYTANGLDCKISCKTFKVSYVLDTEDILFRKFREKGSINRRKKGSNCFPSDSLISRRAQKFHRWIDGHHYLKKDR